MDHNVIHGTVRDGTGSSTRVGLIRVLFMLDGYEKSLFKGFDSCLFIMNITVTLYCILVLGMGCEDSSKFLAK